MTYTAEVNVGGLVPSTNKRRKFLTHKITEGDNLYRILPPFGTNHGGLPFAEVSLHWFATMGDDGRSANRPLRCSYASIERFCPVCEEANGLYKEKEALIADYVDEDTKKVRWEMVPEEVNAKYKQLNVSFSNLKAQRHYYYNALDTSGNVGILRLPKTAATKLGEKIQQAIQTYGFNPLSLEKGAVFNIIQKKTGPKAFNVEYDVQFVTKSVTGPNGVQLSIPLEPAPENVLKNYETLAYDVHAMYPIVTAAELQRAMMGDSSVWAELDGRKKAKSEAEKAAEVEATSAAKITKPAVAQVVTAPVATPEPTVVVESAPVVTVSESVSATPVQAESSGATSALSEEDAELARLREELKV